MPYYNVKLIAFCDVLVKAEGMDDALQRATDEADFGDFNLDTGGPAKRVGAAEVERYKRHADRVLDDA
ncbi:MAG TPA: hypothetical protein VFN69_04460 [Rudaea sp.]|nr:hypothetical protein [Rudaea sp.]